MPRAVRLFSPPMPKPGPFGSARTGFRPYRPSAGDPVRAAEPIGAGHDPSVPAPPPVHPVEAAVYDTE